MCDTDHEIGCSLINGAFEVEILLEIVDCFVAGTLVDELALEH